MTVLPAHIPRNLHKIIRFDLFTKQLVEFCNAGVMYGRPPYEPAVVCGQFKWKQGNTLIESPTRETRRRPRRAGLIPWAACWPSPAPCRSTVVRGKDVMCAIKRSGIYAEDAAWLSYSSLKRALRRVNRVFPGCFLAVSRS